MPGSGVIALPVYSLFPTVSIVLLLLLILYATIFHVTVLSADVESFHSVFAESFNFAVTVFVDTFVAFNIPVSVYPSPADILCSFVLYVLSANVGTVIFFLFIVNSNVNVPV